MTLRHIAQALQQLAKEALGRLRVPPALDQHVEYIAVLINRSPEIMEFAPDANEHLVKKPLVSRLWSPPLERLPEVRPKGSVALTAIGYNEPTDVASSCGKTKQLVHQADFAFHARMSQQAVAAADHSHHLKTLQGRRRRVFIRWNPRVGRIIRLSAP